MLRGTPQRDREALGGGLQGLRAPPLEIGSHDEAVRLEKALGKAVICAEREGMSMKHAHDLVTERLIIRRFTLEDWAAIQELARDIDSHEAAKYDCPWPTSDEECKGMADYFSKRESSWAVCLKADKRLIGYISYNDIDDDKRLDLGHVFHSEFYGKDYDTEALRCMIEYAFTHLDIRSIYANNAEEWTVQLAPLKELGMKTIRRGTMEITKEEWLYGRKNADPKVARFPKFS